MTALIRQNNYNKSVQNGNKDISFKGDFKGITKAADLFIKSQENLSSTRFIQDTITNWVPKAIFSRSIADFSEMSFLEFIESGIFYFASPLLGEKIFRNKVFKNFVPDNLKKQVNENIPKTAEQIKNSILPEEIKKRTIAQKAGIVLACCAIPAAEYTLSFAKNLFTLKTFKKSNFNNIADLDKNGTKENKEQQNKVENHAVNQLKKAGIISLAGVISGALLAVNGHKSNKLQKLSEAILNPGRAFTDLLAKNGIKSNKITNAVKGISLDFKNESGKLALSRGQLGLTAILGLFGYSNAAKDRGKLDVLEVWTRVPLVVFYTIFGSELFEKAFGILLNKKNIFPDLLTKNNEGRITAPSRKELPEYAEKIAIERNTNQIKELERLTREKAVVSAVPYIFSLVFMGFALSAVTRFLTQFRYNHLHRGDKTAFSNRLPDIYKDIKL